MTAPTFEWQSWGVPPAESVPFGSPDWRFLQVTEADSVDRSAPAYDDSGFTVAEAPFANAASGDHAARGWLPFVTPTGLNVGFWLRRTIRGVPGVPMTLSLRIDGNVRAYWNGALVVTDLTDGSKAIGPVVLPAALESNVLAVHVQDDAADPTGDYIYADVEVVPQ